MGDLVDVSPDDLLEIRAEQVKLSKLHDEKEKTRRKGDFNGIGFHGRSNSWPMPIKIGGGVKKRTQFPRNRR